jgi:pimeloyl-ACP methyl ester carboxylesterase
MIRHLSVAKQTLSCSWQRTGAQPTLQASHSDSVSQWIGFRMPGDMEQVATALKLHKLLVVGSSVGATYALALAAYLPDRVQAALLISPSGSTGAVL